MSFPNLFNPLKVGAIEVKNRFIMAPLTRCRATVPGNIPNALMAEYYSQRASAGLIISEATIVGKNLSAFYSEGGIYSPEQVEGWKLTTKAVHDQGGLIFCQLYHGGRACPSCNNEGQVSVAPSAKGCGGGHKIYPPFNAKREMLDYETPRALDIKELPGIVELFVNAAKNAIEAGFDGVEVHGANGYLLDEFLKESANERTDEYGGSIENRSRLLLEVTAAVSKAIGADRVGVRISPLNSYNDMKTEDPIGLARYLATKFQEQGLAYLHLMRADFFQAQTGDVVTPVREAFKGPLMLNMGLELEEADKAIAAGQYDLACFGTKFLANPDLPARAKINAELNAPKSDLFYTTEAEGYTDYPFLKA